MNGYLLNVLKIAFSVLLLLPLTGCCGEVFRGSNDVVGVSIAPTNGSIQPGTTQSFTATGTFAVNGGTGDVTTQTTWTSSDTTIATINNSGLTTGIKFGTVTITGNCQCYASKTNLTVSSNAVSLTSIAVTPANATVKAGLTQQFTATGTYSNGTTTCWWRIRLGWDRRIWVQLSSVTLNATTDLESATSMLRSYCAVSISLAKAGASQW